MEELESLKVERHRCINCGCRIFKIVYDNIGVISVICNKCNIEALIVPLVISTIPLKNGCLIED